jgi:hypothetical protein
MEEQMQKAKDAEQKALKELAEVKRQAEVTRQAELETQKKAHGETLQAMQETVRRAEEAENDALRQLAEETQKVGLQTKMLESLRATQEKRMAEETEVQRQAAEKRETELETQKAHEAKLRDTWEAIRRAEEAEKNALRELAEERKKVELEAKMRMAEAAERKLLEEKMRKAEEAEQNAVKELEERRKAELESQMAERRSPNRKAQAGYQRRAELVTGTYIITNRKTNNVAILRDSDHNSSVVVANQVNDSGEMVRDNSVPVDRQLTTTSCSGKSFGSEMAPTKSRTPATIHLPMVSMVSGPFKGIALSEESTLSNGRSWQCLPRGPIGSY